MSAARLRKRPILFALLLVIIVVGVGVIVWLAQSGEAGCGFGESSETCGVNPAFAGTTSGSDMTFSYADLAAATDESGTAIGFTLGIPDAPVTIIEFSDFACEACHELSLAMKQIIEEYVRPGKAHIIYKPISLVTPGASIRAAAAAYCASRQNRFWEMYDQIWAAFEAGGPDNYTDENLIAQAKNVEGIDVAAFTACLTDRANYDVISAVNAEARARDVAVAPIVFVNERRIRLRRDTPFYDTLRAEIQSELDRN